MRLIRSWVLIEHHSGAGSMVGLFVVKVSIGRDLTS